ncbi:lysophosphatidic acid receptor 6 [Trichomycterus rosablanca]|uniref:lysophosphatidic acid receptor 6 n=1 Tax=Trichomycterus rosablanca TaxID=2290929 RepID=UPI002F35D2AE
MNTSNDSVCGNRPADFQFYLFPITYGLVLVFGLLGNLGALYVYIFRTEQKSPSTIYFISLAVADTMFLSVLPFRIHYHLNGNNWIFGTESCRLTGILFFGNIYISITFMSCICVDRYLATVHPHTYLRLRNTCCSLVVCVTIWGLSGTAILVFMLTSPNTHKNTAENCTNCFENFSETEWKTKLAPFSTFCLIFGALLPLITILVLYPVVARRIAKIRTRTACGALRIIYTIMAITVICFLPFHLVYLLHILWRTKVIDSAAAGDGIFKARRITMALVSMNSLFDPVLYYFATSHCKWTVKWNFKWLKPKKRKGVYIISEDLQAR